MCYIANQHLGLSVKTNGTQQRSMVQALPILQYAKRYFSVHGLLPPDYIAEMGLEYCISIQQSTLTCS